jgi:hypothetical protein
MVTMPAMPSMSRSLQAGDQTSVIYSGVPAERPERRFI